MQIIHFVTPSLSFGLFLKLVVIVYFVYTSEGLITTFQFEVYLVIA